MGIDVAPNKELGIPAAWGRLVAAYRLELKFLGIIAEAIDPLATVALFEAEDGTIRVAQVLPHRGEIILNATIRRTP